jgi:hypothetical protein
MLASLLPGLRDLRTPLATGYMYFLLVFLWLGRGRLLPDQPNNKLLERIYDLSDLGGPAARVTALSFAAYLVGSIFVVRQIDRPRWLVRVLGAGEVNRSTRLYLWIEQQVTTLESSDLGASRLMDRGDIPELFKHELRAALADVQSDPVPQIQSMSKVEREHYLEHRALTSALNSALLSEHEALVTRMQIERETLFNDYDRLRSEAELRLSIFVPLTALAITAAVQWNPPALIGLLIPLILLAQAIRMQARADERVQQALMTGVISSPTIDQLLPGGSRRYGHSHASDRSAKARLNRCMARGGITLVLCDDDRGGPLSARIREDSQGLGMPRGSARRGRRGWTDCGRSASLCGARRDARGLALCGARLPIRARW